MKNGILLINKPKYMTSRDVVNVISKKLMTRKVGHTGTLDPIATGLMIICVNKATGLVDLLTSEDKEYIATVKLGILTDTLDITGNILKENYDYSLNENILKKTLASFVGSYMQEVPIYSAVKVNGKKLYEYARKGEIIDLPKRLVFIKEIELLSFNDDTFSFRVRVSKGTYIRSLIRDIGNKLNIYMTMSELVRTKVDKFSLDDAIELSQVEENKIIEVQNIFDYPKIIVDDNLKKKIVNGVQLENVYDKEIIMFMDNEKKLLAIYKKDEKNKLCLYKLF